MLILFPFLLYAVLVVCSFIFSLSETAYSSLRPILIRIRASKGDKDAERVLLLIRDLPKTINAIIIGDNVINMSFTTIVTFTGFVIDGVPGAVASFLLNLLVVFVFGEAWPKNIALNDPERVAIALAKPMQTYVRIMEAPSSFLSRLGQEISSFAGLKTSKRVEPETEERILNALELGRLEGVISDKQQEVISNVLEIDELTASELMVPLSETVTLDANLTVEDAMKLFGKAAHRRLPVIQAGDRSRPIGSLHILDCTVAYMNGYRSVRVKEICDPVAFVDASEGVDHVLAKMQKMGAHVAAVKDNAKVIGYLFITDLFEELIGKTPKPRLAGRLGLGRKQAP